MNIETDIDSSGIFEENFSSESKQSFCNYVELHSSGFNSLYKAQRFGKCYFLKGLKPEYANQAQFRDLLRKEFDLTVQFDHPNIVRTISFENDAVVGWCLVLEYIDGQTLDEYSKTKEFKSNYKKIIAEILQSLQYIHKKQIVHRDLKPGNILVTANGNNVKIIDFGLADADYYSNLKLPSGTRKYVAPEQISNPKSVDNRADIYSFGIILLDLPLPHYYKRIAKKCANKDKEKRYKDTVEIETAIKVFKTAKIVIPIVVLCLLVISVLLFRTTNSNEEITIQPTDSVEQVKQENDTNSFSLQNVDTIYVETQSKATQKSESTFAKPTTDKPKFDLQKVLEQIDDFYKPFHDSLEQHQYQWLEDATKALVRYETDFLPTIWLPLKDSGVFATEQEEYDAWQKLVPHLTKISEQEANYFRELPIYREEKRKMDRELEDSL